MSVSFEDTIRQIVREEIAAALEQVKLQQTTSVPNDLPPALTVHQAAEVLNIGINKMYDLTRRKGFPAIRDGWKIRIPRDALFRWMEQEAFQNTGEAASR